MGTAVRRRLERGLIVATALVAVLAPVLAAAGASSSIRLPLSVLFVVLVPGAPLAVLLRVPDGRAAASLGLALSVSTLLLACTAALLAGWWDPLRLALGLAVLGLALAVLALWLTRVPRRSAPAPVAATSDAAATPAAIRHRLAAALVRWAPLTLPLAALLIAVELWGWAVLTTDLDQLGPSGVVSVTGPAYWAAVVVVACVAGWALSNPVPHPVLMSAAAVALIVVVFGFTNAADSAPGFPTAWTHVGFIDYISRNGDVAKGFDARFSWPGFFAAGAFVVELAGLPDAAPLIRWAPVLYDVLAIPALLVIGQALTGDRRTAWFGVLLYSGFNWFSQDYLSPQATVLLLYLATLVAMLITAEPLAATQPGRWRRAVTRARRLPPRPPWLTPARALVFQALLIAVVTANVVSHQLTPVVTLGVLLAFTLTGSTRYREMWLVGGLVFLAWFSFGAEDFWRGHLSYVFGDVGKLGSTLGSSVGQRLRGNPVHGELQQVRLLWAAGSLGLAAVGLWLTRRSPRAAMSLVLAFGPFGLLALQSYGGEVALRCFVYAQPALAPLAAVALLRGIALLTTGLSSRLAMSAWLACVVAVAGVAVTVTRGANAGFERVTTSQVRVARVLLQAMPPGSRIGLLAEAGPLGLAHLTEYEPVSLSPDLCTQDVILCVRRSRVDYLYVTRTMDVLGQLKFGQVPGWTDQLSQRLIDLRLYRRLASAPDAYVLGRLEPRS